LCPSDASGLGVSTFKLSPCLTTKSAAICGKRKRVFIRNKFYLMIMLPEFYETNLKRELGRAEYLLLKILIKLLQSIKTVSIEALATALPIPIFFESRRKKVSLHFCL
jgi:hypothetical protein